jgi:hypothetical protein
MRVSRPDEFDKVSDERDAVRVIVCGWVDDYLIDELPRNLQRLGIVTA